MHSTTREKISTAVSAYVGTIGCMFPLDDQSVVRFKVDDGVGNMLFFIG